MNDFIIKKIKKNAWTEKEQFVAKFIQAMINLLAACHQSVNYEEFCMKVIRPRMWRYQSRSGLWSDLELVEKEFEKQDKVINFAFYFEEENKDMLLQMHQQFTDLLQQYKELVETQIDRRFVIHVRVAGPSFTKPPSKEDRTLETVKEWFLENAEIFGIKELVEEFLEKPYAVKKVSIKNQYVSGKEAELNQFFQLAYMKLNTQLIY